MIVKRVSMTDPMWKYSHLRYFDHTGILVSCFTACHVTSFLVDLGYHLLLNWSKILFSLLGPLVLIRCIVSSAANPKNRFLEPSCDFVCLLISVSPSPIGSVIKLSFQLHPDEYLPNYSLNDCIKAHSFSYYPFVWVEHPLLSVSRTCTLNCSRVLHFLNLFHFIFTTGNHYP